ncbi:MAG: nucleotide exchange factor GrpE [Candidatus Liptonbacteria bacterium]|nr:nucleotide exchange factor GrpE [Candidatus Liptonbacteria bacterium]
MDDPPNNNNEDNVNELTELRQKLEMCEKEKEEYLSGWRRSRADYANYKNEEIKRLEDVVKYGNADIIKELIAVLESFDLALQNFNEKEAQNGITRMKDQLSEILRRRGLQKIEVKAGELFDPAYHEVVTQEESERPPDSILEELSAGYTLHGKVIKPSKVKVVK